MGVWEATLPSMNVRLGVVLYPLVEFTHSPAIQDLYLLPLKCSGASHD